MSLNNNNMDNRRQPSFFYNANGYLSCQSKEPQKKEKNDTSIIYKPNNSIPEYSKSEPMPVYFKNMNSYNAQCYLTNSFCKN
jgi:hypothetical protein